MPKKITYFFIFLWPSMNFIILLCSKIDQSIVLNFCELFKFDFQNHTNYDQTFDQSSKVFSDISKETPLLMNFGVRKPMKKNLRQSIKLKIHFNNGWPKNSISNGLKYLVLGEICPVIVHFFCQENRDHQATANDFIDIYLDEVHRVASFSFQ